MLEYRKLLTTPLLGVRDRHCGWREPDNEDWPQRGWVNIGVISNHYSRPRSCRNRLRRAVSAFRGEPCTYLEFYCRQEVDGFIEALREAANVALPTPD